MTLIKGPIVELFWTKGRTNYQHASGVINLQDSIKGSLMITAGCFSWACFMILQVKLLTPLCLIFVFLMYNMESFYP